MTNFEKYTKDSESLAELLTNVIQHNLIHYEVYEYFKKWYINGHGKESFIGWLNQEAEGD